MDQTGGSLTAILLKGVKKIVFGAALLVFVLSVWGVFQEEIIPGITSLAKIKANQLWPSPFSPVARFVANMDWSSGIVSLDATMSKAYQNNIKKYLWRIDDGTGIVSEQKAIQHKFLNPGYYNIKLSIIDDYDQSDEASCLILIPPARLQKVATGEESKAGLENFAWIPEGTFFNFLKLNADERAPGAIQSNYISSDCGLSNKGYNSETLSGDLISLNLDRKEGLAGIFNGFLEILGLGVIGIFLFKYARRWL